jgi:hypothetical protein
MNIGFHCTEVLLTAPTYPHQTDAADLTSKEHLVAYDREEGIAASRRWNHDPAGEMVLGFFLGTIRNEEFSDRDKYQLSSKPQSAVVLVEWANIFQHLVFWRRLRNQHGSLLAPRGITSLIDTRNYCIDTFFVI